MIVTDPGAMNKAMSLTEGILLGLVWFVSVRLITGQPLLISKKGYKWFELCSNLYLAVFVLSARLFVFVLRCLHRVLSARAH